MLGPRVAPARAPAPALAAPPPRVAPRAKAAPARAVAQGAPETTTEKGLSCGELRRAAEPSRPGPPRSSPPGWAAHALRWRRGCHSPRLGGERKERRERRERREREGGKRWQRQFRRFRPCPAKRVFPLLLWLLLPRFFPRATRKTSSKPQKKEANAQEPMISATLRAFLVGVHLFLHGLAGGRKQETRPRRRWAEAPRRWSGAAGRLHGRLRRRFLTAASAGTGRYWMYWYLLRALSLSSLSARPVPPRRFGCWRLVVLAVLLPLVRVTDWLEAA